MPKAQTKGNILRQASAGNILKQALAIAPSIFWRIFVLMLTISLILVAGCKSTKLPEGRLCYGESCFTVEIASTPDSRATGLMYRKQLADDRGMLFVFQENGLYPFWMKNTIIPLDMVWLGAKLNVVHIAENVQPCTADPCQVINPGVEARYVLELNAGTASRLGLKNRDSLTPDYMVLAGANYI